MFTKYIKDTPPQKISCTRLHASIVYAKQEIYRKYIKIQKYYRKNDKIPVHTFHPISS